MINSSNTIQHTTVRSNANTSTQPLNLVVGKDDSQPDDTPILTHKTAQTHNAEQSEEKHKAEEAEDTESKKQAETDKQVSQQESKELRELRARDQEVRAHEQAHTAAAGSLAKGGATYDYQRGPDGRLYAVGGEVQIDTAPVPGDPEATAAKAAQVRRAALAPAQPSQQDRAVAAAASRLEAQARLEIAQQRAEEAKEAVNSRFSDESNSDIENSSESVNTENETETQVTCAECGGQHSAASHSVSVKLEKTFTQIETEAFAFAIQNSTA